MGKPLGQPWVGDDGTVFFAEKPIVDGLLVWDSETAVTVSGEERTVSGNGLPDHPTGDYPADMSSEAWQYDPNPNTISAADFSYAIPADPAIADEPECLPMGPIGVALNGALFFNALDADNRDAVANEVFDACEGHPAPGGQYHYHHGSPCFDQGLPDEHSLLVGHALDGFGIYGPRDAGGVLMTNDDLDECHGHTGPIPTGNSSTIDVYHYHLNEQFPYTLGCFRGVANLPAGPRGASLPQEDVIE